MIGVLVGSVLLVRVAELTQWRQGALWSSVIGFIIGALTVGQVVVNGADLTSALITGGTGAVIGALAGGVTSHLRKQRVMRFPER